MQLKKFSMLSHQEYPLRWIGLCLVLVGIFSSVIAQENSERKWSVRKTGAFGRRVDSAETISQELELPSKSYQQFRLHEPNLETAESRGFGFSGRVIRKPSQNLELPYAAMPYSQDQEAQATGDFDGYDYTPPSPVGKLLPDDDPDATQSPSDFPDPNEPDVISGNPFVLANEEQIDADNLNAQRDSPPPSQSPSSRSGQCTDDNDPNCWPHGYEGVISGKAGEDYPILSEIVPTDFNCDDQQYSGYYADTDERARCQIFHICLKRNKYRKTQQWSFLCPNGTLFSQNDFVCVWWGDAPECDGATVRSLYNLNEQLGWDNITEGPSEFGRNKVDKNNGELQSAMSAFSPANSFSSEPMVPTTYRPSNHFSKGGTLSNSRTAHPYRVPVKVSGESGRPRTKLQEVTQNALHGDAHELDYGDNIEHDVDESSNFETSLKQRSESRHRSKTASSFRTSESEGYELKGSPDGVQPFVVNQPREPDTKTSTELPQFNYDDSENEEIPQVVMMRTRQRLPDGSEGYAEVPVMLPHGTTVPADEEGYNYPNPTQTTTSTPAPTYLPPFRETTTERPTYRTTTTTEYFPPPTIPTEPPIDHDNYDQEYRPTQRPASQDSQGYRYTNPTTTEPSGYRQNMKFFQTSPPRENKYPQAQPDNEVDRPEDGYQSSQPNTEPPNDNYDAPHSQQAAGQEQPDEGYRYQNPTPTTEPFDQGYRYQSPTTTSRSQNLRNTYPTTTTEYPTTTEQVPEHEGYQYQAPNKQTQLQEPQGYNYSAQTTTENFSFTKHSSNEEYQVTESNDATSDYQFEPTRTPDIPRAEYGLPDDTSGVSTERNQDLLENEVTTITSAPVSNSPNKATETPAGGYLPPKDKTNESSPAESAPQSPTPENEQIDYDTIGISATGNGGADTGSEGGEGSDYEEEGNELDANPTGPTDGGEDGYSYNLPNPQSSTSNPVVVQGGSLGTHTQLHIPGLREQISKNRQRITDINDNGNGNNGLIDSDDKINDILKQIQNGGIVAVDSSGKEIDFAKLKELLLSSPRGSVELKGEAELLASSTTEVPKSPQTQQVPQTQAKDQQPFYHTVTTAQVMPPNDNENNILFNSNQNQVPLPTTSSFSGSPSPSDFYLPPELNNNNNNNIIVPTPQYVSNHNVQFVQPSYDIKLPNREFESHSVQANTLDNNNNNNHNVNNNFFIPQNNHNSSPQPQQQYPQISNFVTQEQPVQPQYFPSQPGPTLSTSLIIPPNNDQLPATSPPQPQVEYNNRPVVQNAVVEFPPFAESQPPFQHNEISSQHHNRPSESEVPSQQLQGEYLPPPRQASSSLLQSNYYNTDATSQQPSRQYLSEPFKLTEDIEVQQSFARPLAPNGNDFGNKDNSPLDPKSIKIVPALFVHEHTSVAAQAGNAPGSGSSSSNSNRGFQQPNLDNAFQTLETAQSVYPPSYGSGIGANKGSLAQQLNELANSVYAPPSNNNNVGRQFFRRSNAGESSSTSSSSSSSEPSHTIEKATRVTSFTLEDARTPEELQKYHHQDLKRFHSENIAKQGSILDDVLPSIPSKASQTTSTPFEHRFGPVTQSELNDERERGGGGGRRRENERVNVPSSRSSSSINTNTSSTPSRFSINSSNLSSNSGRNNGEYFIPISGSYGGGESGRSGNRGNVGSSDNNNNRDDNSRDDGGSQFRVSGRGSARSFDTNSGRRLRRRFLPQEQAGFGSRLLN